MVEKHYRLFYISFNSERGRVGHTRSVQKEQHSSMWSEHFLNIPIEVLGSGIGNVLFRQCEVYIEMQSVHARVRSMFNQ